MKFIILFIIGLLVVFASANFAQNAPEGKPEEEIFTEEPGYEVPPEPRPAERVQLELPDISVIGLISGKLTNDDNDFARNKILLDEVELGLQSYLYPSIRGDVFLAMHRHNGHMEAEAEEAYIRFLKVSRDLSLKAGKALVGFGKINALHSHHRPYIDLPPVVTNFFGDHGLVGEGAAFSYLLPTKTFAQLDLAYWYVGEPHEDNGENGDEEHVPGIGLIDRVKSTRLWTSTALTELAELETGLNYAWNSQANVTGIDIRYKHWPSAYERLTLQGELFTGKNKNHDINMQGFYLFANQRVDKYWDYGLRYDWTELAEPKRAHQSGISLIATNHLTETTFMRAQYKYIKSPIGSAIHEFYLQFVFGMGPHAHPLE